MLALKLLIVLVFSAIVAGAIWAVRAISDDADMHGNIQRDLRPWSATPAPQQPGPQFRDQL